MKIVLINMVLLTGQISAADELIGNKIADDVLTLRDGPSVPVLGIEISQVSGIDYITYSEAYGQKLKTSAHGHGTEIALLAGEEYPFKGHFAGHLGGSIQGTYFNSRKANGSNIDALSIAIGFDCGLSYHCGKYCCLKLGPRISIGYVGISDYDPVSLAPLNGEGLTANASIRAALDVTIDKFDIGIIGGLMATGLYINYDSGSGAVVTVGSANYSAAGPFYGLEAVTQF